MADWNAALYLRFAAERTRPAAELLARVPLASARSVVDLGCGPGNSTELLAQRFPQAELIGVDTSDDMLAAAREHLPAARFLKADLVSWRPEAPLDLLFANAVLQWVPAHETLFPALLGCLEPGGVLAVQMPDNRDEPSHALMRETAADGPWATRLGRADAIRTPILAAERYYDLLAGAGAEVDIWRTTYHHVLDDAAAIVAWVRATGLKPFVDPLDEEQKTAFLAAYEERLAGAYGRRADGKVLLAFPRLFMVARRA